MSDLEKQYQKAFKDYLEARDNLWSIRDRMIKKQTKLSTLKLAKQLIENLLKKLSN